MTRTSRLGLCVSGMSFLTRRFHLVQSCRIGSIVSASIRSSPNFCPLRMLAFLLAIMCNLALPTHTRFWYCRSRTSRTNCERVTSIPSGSSSMSSVCLMRRLFFPQSKLLPTISHVLRMNCKVAFCEDNQATTHIIQTGNSAQLRHARTSLARLREQCLKGFFNLVNVNTVYQVADILTKPFTSKAKWDHACNLIGVRWVQLDGHITIKPAPASEAQASAVSTHETYMIVSCANFAVRMIPSSATNQDYPHMVAKC